VVFVRILQKGVIAFWTVLVYNDPTEREHSHSGLETHKEAEYYEKKIYDSNRRNRSSHDHGNWMFFQGTS
jgi:hypothetical protein